MQDAACTKGVSMGELLCGDMRRKGQSGETA